MYINFCICICIMNTNLYTNMVPTLLSYDLSATKIHHHNISIYHHINNYV